MLWCKLAEGLRPSIANCRPGNLDEDINVMCTSLVRGITCQVREAFVKRVFYVQLLAI